FHWGPTFLVFPKPWLVTFTPVIAHETDVSPIPRRTLRRRTGRGRSAVRGIALVRLAAVASGHPRLARAGGDAAQNWGAERRRVAGHQPRFGYHRTRNCRREVSVATGARGCAHEHRGGADPARAGGREAPHRPFAERPGGVGSEALAAG